jgi:hypothetical protein
MNGEHIHGFDLAKHIVIPYREGKSSSIASIRKLREHTPVFDVRVAEGIPTELT